MMLKQLYTHLHNTLASPVFADEDQTRRAQLLHTFLKVSTVANSLSACLMFSFSVQVAMFAIFLALLGLMMLVLVHKGQFTVVGIVALVALAPIFYTSNFTGHQSIGPGTSISLIAILAAAFIYGKRGMFVTLVFSTVMLLIVTSVKYLGTSDQALRWLIYFDAISYLFIFFVWTLALAVALNALTAALQRARESQAALKRNNEQLEERIAQRTRQLAERETYYRTLVENTSDIVCIISLDGNTLYESPSFERVTGFAMTDAQGQSIYKRIHPDDAKTLRDGLHFFGEIEDKQTRSEARFLRKDGSYFVAEVLTRKIESGDLAGNFVLSKRDVTERKQLERVAARRTEIDQLLVAVSAKIAQSSLGEMDEIIRHVLKQTGEFVGADIAQIFVFNSQDKTLANRYEWVKHIADSQAPRVMPFDQYQWWYKQILDFKTICFSDTNDIPHGVGDIRDEIIGRGVKSLMSIPMMRGTEFLGEAGFDTLRSKKIWQDEEIVLLKTVTEMLASLMDRKRSADAVTAERRKLEVRVQERTQELARLLDVSRALNGTLQLEPLLSHVLRELGDIIPNSSAGISEFDHEFNARLLAYSGPVPQDKLARYWSYDDVTDAHLKKAIMEQKPMIVNDTAADTPLAQAVRRRYTRFTGSLPLYVASIMHVPLIVRGKLVGLMTLTSENVNAFTTRHAELTQTFANQAAVAMENARLHEREVQAAALTERSRIARDLHDSVSQALFGIVLGSRTLMQLASKDNDSKLIEPSKYVTNLAEAALAEMRSLIFELHPESLQREGLIVAFQRQAEMLCARFQIQVNADLGGVEPPIPIEAKEAMYRIGLEAVQNSIKHAHASKMNFNLHVNQSSVSLEIRDNGVGFNADEKYLGHYGLLTMQDRAKQHGGKVSVHSGNGDGTTIHVQMPMNTSVLEPA